MKGIVPVSYQFQGFEVRQNQKFSIPGTRLVLTSLVLAVLLIKICIPIVQNDVT
jgi:hypothetical protein